MKTKAPAWVMAVTMLVITIGALISILTMVGIMPVESISLNNEYGESATTTYSLYGYTLNIVYILVFLAIAVLSLTKKWSPLILIGASLLILENIITLYDFARLLSIDDCQALIDRNKNWQMTAIGESLLFLSGTILIFWNTSATRILKIASTVLVVLITIGNLLPISSSTVYIAISAIKALLAITLCYLIFKNINHRTA